MIPWTHVTHHPKDPNGISIQSVVSQQLPTGRPTLMAIGVAGPTVWNSLRISSGTRRAVQTPSDVYLKRICTLDTSVFSALEVFDDNCAISIYSLAYLFTTERTWKSTGYNRPLTLYVRL